MSIPVAAILSNVRAILAGPDDRDDKLLAICLVLAEQVPHYHWVGFYLAVPQEQMLELGPFVGEPTDHVRIPYGRGICGRVAQSEQTLVIPDVTAESNYLACSIRVRAEIVVPVMRDGRFVAQLDIDSHDVDPFTTDDHRLLEEICLLVAVLFA